MPSRELEQVVQVVRHRQFPITSKQEQEVRIPTPIVIALSVLALVGLFTLYEAAKPYVLSYFEDDTFTPDWKNAEFPKEKKE